MNLSHPHFNMFRRYMRDLVSKCAFHWRSKIYDRYQRVLNGIH